MKNVFFSLAFILLCAFAFSNTSELNVKPRFLQEVESLSLKWSFPISIVPKECSYSITRTVMTDDGPKEITRTFTINTQGQADMCDRIRTRHIALLDSGFISF